MLDIIMSKVLPVNAVFIIGYLLKKRGVLKKEDGGTLLKLTFHVLIPAMLFGSMKDLDLSWGMVWYPVLIFIIQGIMYVAGETIYRLLKLTPKERPVLIASLMIMNTGFILPFFIAFYGQEDVWRIGLLDFGNALIAFSFVYNLFLGNKGDERKKSRGRVLMDVVKTPPVVGMLLGVVGSLTGIHVPVAIDVLTGNLSNLVGPVVMLALGLYFNPKIEKKSMTVAISLTKFMLGFAVAGSISSVLGLQGLSRVAVYLMSCSPVGANVLTFSVLTDSDMELASGVVSFSIVLNLFLIPGLLIYLS